MIETKFSEFFRSPRGVLLTIGVIALAAILVLFLVSRVFQGLLTPTPYLY